MMANVSGWKEGVQREDSFKTHSKEVSLTYSKTNYDCNTMHTNPTESKGVKVYRVYQVEFGNMKQFSDLV